MSCFLLTLLVHMKLYPGLGIRIRIDPDLGGKNFQIKSEKMQGNW